MAPYESNYFGHFIFFKVSDEYKVLKGQKYEIMAYDESSTTGRFLEEGQYGQYYMRDSNYSYDNNSFSINILPQYFRDFMDSINSYEDYYDFAQSKGINLNGYYSTWQYNLPALLYRFYIPVKLKEITGTPGYKKQDLAIIFNVDFEIMYDRDTHEALYKYVRTEAWNSWFVDLDDYKDIKNIDDLISVNNSPQEYDGEYSCINTNNDMIIMDSFECTYSDQYGSTGYTLVPYFVEEKGTVKFEIENTVNGLTKYNASKDKNLKYEISIKNIGDVESTNNIIKTFIPEEIEVKEDSISDNGVYDKDGHFITWNLNMIDVGNVYSFTYDALAPNETNGKDLIGKSSIESDQVLDAVFSSNTIVTLDKIVEIIENPNTGTMVYLANSNIGLPLSYLMMLLITFFVVILFLVRKLKKTH